MVNYGEVLRRLRVERQLTQQALAEKLNVAPQTVSKWEKGINQIDLDTTRKICALFGIGLDEFLRLAEDGSLSGHTVSAEATVAKSSAEGELAKIDNVRRRPKSEMPPVPAYAMKDQTITKKLYIMLTTIFAVAILVFGTTGGLLINNWVHTNVTYTAKYVDGYRVVRTETVNYGEYFSGSAETVTGYTFEGWYQDKERTQPFDFTVIPRNDVTIYGRWSPIPYNVRYYFSLTGGEYFDQLQTYDKSFTLPECPFTNNGYNFAGWQIGGETYDAGYSLENLITRANGTVSVYALWKPIQYTITYYSPENSKGDTFTYTYGDRFRPFSLSRHGYGLVKAWYIYNESGGFVARYSYVELQGWCAYDLNGKRIDGDYATHTIKDGENLRAESEWEEITYRVIYHHKDGTTETHYYKYKEEFVTPEILGTPDDGYMFDGWRFTVPTDNIDHRAAVGETLSKLTFNHYSLTNESVEFYPVEVPVGENEYVESVQRTTNDMRAVLIWTPKKLGKEEVL